MLTLLLIHPILYNMSIGNVVGYVRQKLRNLLNVFANQAAISFTIGDGILDAADIDSLMTGFL